MGTVEKAIEIVCPDEYLKATRAVLIARATQWLARQGPFTIDYDGFVYHTESHNSTKYADASLHVALAKLVAAVHEGSE